MERNKKSLNEKTIQNKNTGSLKHQGTSDELLCVPAQNVGHKPGESTPSSAITKNKASASLQIRAAKFCILGTVLAKISK